MCALTGAFGTELRTYLHRGMTSAPCARTIPTTGKSQEKHVNGSVSGQGTLLNTCGWVDPAMGSRRKLSGKSFPGKLNLYSKTSLGRQNKAYRICLRSNGQPASAAWLGSIGGLGGALLSAIRAEARDRASRGAAETLSCGLHDVVSSLLTSLYPYSAQLNKA